MRLQFRKNKGLSPAILACAVFVLGAVWLVLLLCLQGNGKKEIILGQRDEFALIQGAPDMTGKPLEISRQDLLQGTLMLVSPQYPLPIDFPVPNTRAIRAMVGAYLPALEDVALWRDAVYALCAMQLEYPLENGVSLIRGTLSSAQQEDWRRAAFDRYAKVYPLNEALNRAFAAVPGGGESEHQTGYALDITLTGTLSLGNPDPILRNAAGKWLDENMWRFGWIYRYGPGHANGGSCEGIHLRYVGQVHAAAMHALNLELEDYLAFLRQQERLTLKKEGRPYAYLYCVPNPDNWQIFLEPGTEYLVSADNTGWAIAAIAAQDVF